MKNDFCLNSAFELRDATLRVLVLYDDRAAGQRAMRLLDRLSRQIGDGIELRLQLWRFDLLREPEGSVLAHLDALEADLLILASSAEGDLNVEMKHWLQKLLLEKRDSQAAVVVLFGNADCQTILSPGLRFVRAATTEAGLNFFAPHAASPAAAQANLDR